MTLTALDTLELLQALQAIVQANNGVRYALTKAQLAAHEKALDLLERLEATP